MFLCSFVSRKTRLNDIFVKYTWYPWDKWFCESSKLSLMTVFEKFNWVLDFKCISSRLTPPFCTELIQSLQGHLVSTPVALKYFSQCHSMFATHTSTSRPPHTGLPVHWSLIPARPSPCHHLPGKLYQLKGTVAHSAVHRWAFFSGISLSQLAMLSSSQETCSVTSTTYKGMDCCLLEGGYSTQALFSHSFTGLSDRQWEWGPHGSSQSQHYRHSLTPHFRTMFHSSPHRKHCIETDTAQPGFNLNSVLSGPLLLNLKTRSWQKGIHIIWYSVTYNLPFELASVTLLL